MTRELGLLYTSAWAVRMRAVRIWPGTVPQRFAIHAAPRPSSDECLLALTTVALPSSSTNRSSLAIHDRARWQFINTTQSPDCKGHKGRRRHEYHRTSQDKQLRPCHWARLVPGQCTARAPVPPSLRLACIAETISFSATAPCPWPSDTRRTPAPGVRPWDCVAGEGHHVHPTSCMRMQGTRHVF